MNSTLPPPLPPPSYAEVMRTPVSCNIGMGIAFVSKTIDKQKDCRALVIPPYIKNYVHSNYFPSSRFTYGQSRHKFSRQPFGKAIPPRIFIAPLKRGEVLDVNGEIQQLPCKFRCIAM